MTSRWLTALPVYNEQDHVSQVLDEVVRYSPEILVIDDGSSDQTGSLLKQRDDIRLVTHPVNRGYGAALISAFQYALERDFEYLVTIDCDGQHQPQRIPRFISACPGADIVSGSRYIKQYPGDDQPPAERQWINQLITNEINSRLGFCISDAFCGFKAYRVASLKGIELTEQGYAMPLEFWVHAAKHDLKIIELPVPLIYLDETRSFGGNLDDGTTRLKHYRDVLEQSIQRIGIREPPTKRRDSGCANRG